MKKKFQKITLILFSLIIIILFLTELKKDSVPTIPKIAIAGLGIESSTFSPAVTLEDAFHPKIGNEIFERYPFLSSDSNSNEFIKLWLTVSILLRAESSHKVPMDELDNAISGRMYLVYVIEQIRYAIILVVLWGKRLKKYKKLFFKRDDPIEFTLAS